MKILYVREGEIEKNYTRPTIRIRFEDTPVEHQGLRMDIEWKNYLLRDPLRDWCVIRGPHKSLIIMHYRYLEITRVWVPKEQFEKFVKVAKPFLNYQRYY